MSKIKRAYFPEIYELIDGIESTEQPLSNCCGSSAVGEIIDELGICTACYEWASFNV